MLCHRLCRAWGRALPVAGVEAGKAALGGRDGDEGVDGPQGLYVIHLARVSPLPEEVKAAGIGQVLEGRHVGG